ncbi:conserved hypothetical protein, partial [Ricinus communis]
AFPSGATWRKVTEYARKATYDADRHRKTSASDRSRRVGARSGGRKPGSARPHGLPAGAGRAQSFDHDAPPGIRPGHRRRQQFPRTGGHHLPRAARHLRARQRDADAGRRGRRHPHRDAQAGRGVRGFP